VSQLPLPVSERLKRKMRKPRAKKADHEMAGKELARDIAAVEALLLDVILDERDESYRNFTQSS
jgi:hypothetical protein